MKKLKTKILKALGILIGSIAFVGAQGSFMFWNQPRAPKHLKRD